MLDNKIEFIITNKDMEGIWPSPIPAVQAIPNEYKTIKRLTNNNLKSSTVKTCVPFLDSMTTGYIIPFDQDYVVDTLKTNFTIAPSDPNEKLEFHDKIQLPPEWHSKIGKAAGKMNNKWLIKTPPGYSCLFVHPLNHLLNDKVNFLSGIVDTDTYINTINFPFIIMERGTQFMLKKGDPMIQVIPFKREQWKIWSGFKREILHGKTIRLLQTQFMDKYKNLFWNKKSFK